MNYNIISHFTVFLIKLCFSLQHEMELKKLKEEMMAVDEKAALYLSDLNSYKSQNADVDSTFKELQNKLELCEKEKVLFVFFNI